MGNNQHCPAEIKKQFIWIKHQPQQFHITANTVNFSCAVNQNYLIRQSD